jgi:hypothetical protein
MDKTYILACFIENIENFMESTLPTVQLSERISPMMPLTANHSVSLKHFLLDNVTVDHFCDA